MFIFSHDVTYTSANLFIYATHVVTAAFVTKLGSELASHLPAHAPVFELLDMTPLPSPQSLPVAAIGFFLRTLSNHTSYTEGPPRHPWLLYSVPPPSDTATLAPTRKTSSGRTKGGSKDASKTEKYENSAHARSSRTAHGRARWQTHLAEGAWKTGGVDTLLYTEADQIIHCRAMERLLHHLQGRGSF